MRAIFPSLTHGVLGFWGFGVLGARITNNDANVHKCTNVVVQPTADRQAESNRLFGSRPAEETKYSLYIK